MCSYTSIAIVGRHSVLLSVLRYQWFSYWTKLCHTLQMNFIPRTFWFFIYCWTIEANVPMAKGTLIDNIKI